MANLISRAPAQLTDLTIGGVTLSEPPMTEIWAILPYPGATTALSAALEKAHGVPFPAPGKSHAQGDARILWSGQDQAFLVGATADASLAAHAGLSDQSDAWTCLHLTGDAAVDVLARLVPIDLSLGALPVGSAVRTGLGHMSALIHRHAADGFALYAFRSMAGTMVHELERAMKMVAARETL